MNPTTEQQVKKLILKTIERRNAVTDRDLSQIPLLGGVSLDLKDLGRILAELVENKDIMFLEFIQEDKPGTVHTMYFPNGTVVYEPGLSVKDRILPDNVHDFFVNMIKRKVVEEDFVTALSREDKITYYEAIHAHVQAVGTVPRKLDLSTTKKILERLVIEEKVTLREDHIC